MPSPNMASPTGIFSSLSGQHLNHGWAPDDFADLGLFVGSSQYQGSESVRWLLPTYLHFRSHRRPSFPHWVDFRAFMKEDCLEGIQDKSSHLGTYLCLDTYCLMWPLQYPFKVGIAISSQYRRKLNLGVTHQCHITSKQQNQDSHPGLSGYQTSVYSALPVTSLWGSSRLPLGLSI